MMRKIEIYRGEIAICEPGPAAMLDWIEIARLVVDDTYQRGLKPSNWKNIHRIAKNFRWSRFSTVLVAPVEGGLFAIIDGQHRTHAAAMCGIEKVPCQIVQMTPAEQAESFAAVNGMVTAITSMNIFKASLAAGDPAATKTADICQRAGCVLKTVAASSRNKQAGEIYAAKSFQRLIVKYPDDLGRGRAEGFEIGKRLSRHARALGYTHSGADDGGLDGLS